MVSFPSAILPHPAIFPATHMKPVYDAAMIIGGSNDIWPAVSPDQKTTSIDNRNAAEILPAQIGPSLDLANNDSSTNNTTNVVFHFCILPRPEKSLLEWMTSASPVNSPSNITRSNARQSSPSAGPRLHTAPVFVRIFNSSVEVVGAVLTYVPRDATVEYLVAKTVEMISPVMERRGVDRQGSFRLLLPRPDGLEVWPPGESTELAFTAHGEVNCFARWLRLEPVPAEVDGINLPNAKSVIVCHATVDRHFFGHPFEIFVQPGERLVEAKWRIEKKLQITSCGMPSASHPWDFSRWRFYSYDLEWRIRSFLRDDDVLQLAALEPPRSCLLAEHPSPSTLQVGPRRYAGLHIR